MMRRITFMVCIFFVSFFSSCLSAFAAVTSGYVSPVIVKGESNVGGILKKSVDSNLNSFANLGGNGYITYQIPSGSSSMKIHLRSSISSEDTASYRIVFSNSQGTVWDSGNKKVYSSLVSYDFNIPSTATVVTVYSTSYKDYYALLVHEVEMTVPIDKTPPHEVTNLVTSSSYNHITITFNQPADSDYAGTRVYVNGVLVETLGSTITSYRLTELKPNTIYNIKITTFDTSNNESDGITTLVKTLPPPDVTNLNLFPSDYSILAKWINPDDSGFLGNDLYLDGKIITSLDKNATTYTFTDLSPNTSYTVKIVSKYSGGYSSSGQTATTKTTIPVEDITDLQADAKYDRVKLSWALPEHSEFFSHVKIYRKKLEQQSFWDQLFGATAVSAATTSDGYTPMFETNGTYWTDLTVTPDTTYAYKVTSVNIEGNESQGVTIKTKTPSEPAPVLTGVATTQNENGDYIVTWTSPTKGSVKVLIGGKKYTVVDAASQQVMIKKEDMKTDFFGGYDAKLVPVGQFGTEGQAVQVPAVGKKIEFPITFDDFMKTVVNILSWAAPLILVLFVFIFWRPFIVFLRKTIFVKGGRMKS